MSSYAGAGAGAERPAPGPLADEALRLVEALSDWARGHAGDLPGSLSQHIGGTPECTICPLCQAIGLLRHTKPETFAHLVEASAAMTAALRSIVDNAHTQRGRSGVERIDLDDDRD
jgi:hypothetical protein